MSRRSAIRGNLRRGLFAVNDNSDPIAAIAGLVDRGQPCALGTGALADPFPAHDWPCDPRPFYPEAHWEVECLTKATAVGSRVAQRRASMSSSTSATAPRISARRASRSRACSLAWPSPARCRKSTEAVARSHEEGLPRRGDRHAGVLLARGPTTSSVPPPSFPLFVKHYSSYSSVGLSRRSRDRHGRIAAPGGQDHAAPRRGADRGVHRGDGGGGARRGRLDDPSRPKTYTPMQYRFPAGETFKDSRMKWVEYAAMPVPCAIRRSMPACATSVRRFFLALARASALAYCASTPNRYASASRSIHGVDHPPKDAGSADLCLLHDPEGHVGFIRGGAAARQPDSGVEPCELGAGDIPPCRTRREGRGLKSAASTSPAARVRPRLRCPRSARSTPSARASYPPALASRRSRSC